LAVGKGFFPCRVKGRNIENFGQWAKRRNFVCVRFRILLPFRAQAVKSVIPVEPVFFNDKKYGIT